MSGLLKYLGSGVHDPICSKHHWGKGNKKRKQKRKRPCVEMEDKSTFSYQSIICEFLASLFLMCAGGLPVPHQSRAAGGNDDTARIRARQRGNSATCV